MIHGQILDRQIKKNLTLDRLKDFRRVDPSGLPLENAIPMGEGKRKLYVFTDPQCYFCFQLHEELKQIKDLQTFFFLYPLLPRAQNSLHFVLQGFSLAVSRPKGLPYKNDIFRCKQYYAPLNNSGFL